MTEFVNIRVVINDGNFEKFCDKYGIECPENYDLGGAIDNVEQDIYDMCYAKDNENSIDGLLAKAVKRDIIENYSTREYEVRIETREYVTRTYYYTVEAKNEDEARDMAVERCENDGGEGYDDEDFDGFDSLTATDVTEV